MTLDQARQLAQKALSAVADGKDTPQHDRGGNFGRLARSGVMEKYIDELFADKLSGIPLLAWQKFLGLFTESQTDEDLANGLDRLAAAYPSAALPEGKAEQVRDKLAELGAIIAGPTP